jgi:XTP/dITP diphosphohydrolase
MIGLLLATRNAHKVAEIQAILGEDARCISISGAGWPEVKEDANSLEGNATKKAVSLSKWLSRLRMEQEPEESKGEFSKPFSGITNSTSSSPLVSVLRDMTHVLADDSGLEVDALHGAPGVHSARFAALDTGKDGNSPTAENNAKLLCLLQGVPLEKREARFRCVIALAPIGVTGIESASPVCYVDELEMMTEHFEGTCEGRIGFELRGQGGFGYDPLFFPDGYELTFGELPEAVKNRLSHRAKALQKLKVRLVGPGNHSS